VSGITFHDMKNITGCGVTIVKRVKSASIKTACTKP